MRSMKITDSNNVSLVIVGPPTDTLGGFLLRPPNIYYSLKRLKHLRVKFISVKSVFVFLFTVPHILRADVIIVSGVSPWISALLAVLGKVLRKRIVMDFHTFGWAELNVLGAPFLIKIIVLISEKIAFRFSYCVVVASKWLSNKLVLLFGKKNCVFTIENAVPIIFKASTDFLKSKFEARTLREYVCKHIVRHEDCYNKRLLVAPLPSWFASNVLALGELNKLKDMLGKNTLCFSSIRLDVRLRYLVLSQT